MGHQYQRADAEDRYAGPGLLDGEEALLVEPGLEPAHDVEPHGVGEEVGRHGAQDGRRLEELQVAVLVAPVPQHHDHQGADRDQNRCVLLPADLLVGVSLGDQESVYPRAGDDEPVAHDDHGDHHVEAERVHQGCGGNHEARAHPRPDDPSVVEDREPGGESGVSLLLETAGPSKQQDSRERQAHRPERGVIQKLHARHMHDGLGANEVLDDHPVDGVQTTVSEAHYGESPHCVYPPSGL